MIENPVSTALDAISFPEEDAKLSRISFARVIFSALEKSLDSEIGIIFFLMI
jgi:hypothetical protein